MKQREHETECKLEYIESGLADIQSLIYTNHTLLMMDNDESGHLII